MFKLKITLSYDGSIFNGFQVQSGSANTVSNKLYKIFTSLGIKEKFNASGRTDSGVHATRQVIDIMVPLYWSDLEKLKNHINHKAKPDIYIKSIEKVDKSFHSRFDAKQRVYRYVISTKEFDVFRSRYILHVDRVDEQKIKSAIKLFKGSHNFEYFKKNGGNVTSFVREIYKAEFYAYDDVYVFLFEASGYLRSQIRMMVDFLLKISDGIYCEDDLKNQLSCKKKISSDLVLPNGLYLSKIVY